MNRKAKDKLIGNLLGIEEQYSFYEEVWQEVKIQPEYWSKRLMFIHKLGYTNWYMTKPSRRKKFWRKVYIQLNRHIVQGKLNSHFPEKLRIGAGTIIDHPFNIMINSTAVIGERVRLRHNTTIGNLANGKNNRSPKIGDEVNIGAGATLVGDITIGDYSMVGADAVVTKSFAENAILVGVPAKNLNDKRMENK